MQNNTDNQFARTQLLLGKEAMDKLHSSRVAVFGIGGVGGYVVEALVRSGVGCIDIIDNDTVSITNINRQIIATWDSIGKYKVDVMKERILSINPNVDIRTYNCFYLPENSYQFDFSQYSYVVDALDTVTAKIDIVLQCQKAGTPIIASMGTGNKLNPMLLEVDDIFKTSVCPLAKVMRKELKNRNVKKLKVVYSKEIPIKPLQSNEPTNKRSVPGSTSFVPPTAGLIIAGEVIKDLLN